MTDDLSVQEMKAFVEALSSNNPEESRLPKQEASSSNYREESRLPTSIMGVQPTEVDHKWKEK